MDFTLKVNSRNISCNQEIIPKEELSWVGDWVASIVLKDGVLIEIPTIIDGRGPRYFRIMIEEGDMGTLTGFSFKNTFGSDFQLSPNNQVEFGPIGGTRVQEEVWGGAVLGNIRKTKIYEVNQDSLYFKNLDDHTLILFTKPQ